jgi:stress response protein SCP2
MQMFNQLNRHSFQSSLNMSGGGLNLGGQLSLEAAASDHGIDQLLIQNTQMTSQMMQSQNFRLQPSTFTSSLHHQLPNGNEMFQQSALLPSNNQQHSLSLPQPLFLHESLLLQEQQHQQQRHQQQLSDIDMSAFLTSSASLNEQLSSTFLLQQRRQQQQQQQQPQGQGQQQQPNFFDPSFILSLRNMPLQRTQQQQHQQQRLPILNIPTSSREFDNNRVSRSSNLTGADLSSMMALAQLPNTSSGNPSSTPTEDIYTPVPLLRRAYGRTEPMARPSDESSLSAFQAYARQQIEFFEAVEKDVSQGARGRNVPISLGQVGIRCRHCRDDGPKFRGRAGVYFPTKFELVYQTAVNMTSIHLCQHCTKIPTKIRTKLLELRDQRSTAGGGKSYWAKATKDMGVVETKQGLRFRD